MITPNDSGGWNAPVLADGTENQLGRRYGRFAHDVAAADIRAVAYQGVLSLEDTYDYAIDSIGYTDELGGQFMPLPRF